MGTVLTDRTRLTELVRAACVLEASARKPGNVHPEAAFADVTYDDFVQSAAVAAPCLSRSADVGVGRAILDAVQATHHTVGRNTNLGMALLIAPLAAVSVEQSLPDGISTVLESLTVEDARHVYEAIRMANPGGLGRASEHDIAEEPVVTLAAAMRAAAERDAVAAQYATGFSQVLAVGVPYLTDSGFTENWERAVIHLHLRFMAEVPDTLIARKCGSAIAAESARRARETLEAGQGGALWCPRKLADFDRWLRADGNRRNPGTTADLVAACLFAALRDRHIVIPTQSPAFGIVHFHRRRR